MDGAASDEAAEVHSITVQRLSWLRMHAVCAVEASHEAELDALGVEDEEFACGGAWAPFAACDAETAAFAPARG